MSSDEEKFIHQQETDTLSSQRRERQLDALRSDEREGIAMVLDTNEEVAAEALELGFDQETARVLPLVPLIQVAWADDTVQRGEEKAILAAAAKAGIDEGTAAYEFLSLMLEQKPSELFFVRTMNVVKHMAKGSGDIEWGGRSVLELAKEVAGASGGFFGIGNKISDKEEELLGELAELLSVQDSVLDEGEA